MFEPFIFTKEQIEKYYETSLHDFQIAVNSDLPEVIFSFAYNALIKLAIVICAKNNIRVKSQQGHHIELISKLGEYLNNPEVNNIGNEMRKKRNRDLYEGGIIITEKQAKEYLDWMRTIFNLAKKHL